MAKNKRRCREYTPSGNMTGSHSFYAEAVITTDLTKHLQNNRERGDDTKKIPAALSAIATDGREGNSREKTGVIWVVGRLARSNCPTTSRRW